MIRQCHACGQKNAVPTKHLAHQGRCGACKATLPPLAEPLDADAELFDAVVRDVDVPVLAFPTSPCSSAVNSSSSRPASWDTDN